MARMYAHKRGRSGSKRPVSKKAPPWVKVTGDEVKGLAAKLFREGMSKSVVGQVLRDQYGVPLVRAVTGRRLTQILEDAGEKPGRTEDLDSLLEKARRMREHLARNRSDRLGRHALQLIESKIRRIGRYYVREGILPPDWRYRPA